MRSGRLYKWQRAGGWQAVYSERAPSPHRADDNHLPVRAAVYRLTNGGDAPHGERTVPKRAREKASPGCVHS